MKSVAREGHTRELGNKSAGAGKVTDITSSSRAVLSQASPCKAAPRPSLGLYCISTRLDTPFMRFLGPSSAVVVTIEHTERNILEGMAPVPIIEDHHSVLEVEPKVPFHPFIPNYSYSVHKYP